MIKVTVVGGKYGFKTFRQYVAENGKSVYEVSGKLTTRDEGNRIFRELLARHPGAKVSTSVFGADDIDILKKLRDSIDPYTQYIDNWGQQKAAERENEEIRKIIAAFEAVAKS